MPGRLVDRDPVLDPERLISGLKPPPLFRSASFDSYRPQPGQPTQVAALAAARAFATSVAAAPARSRLRRRPSAGSAPGVYLDGGFGVGKTHLLASVWHAAPEPKAYLTFVELTQLAGALGFAPLVEALSSYRLLAIDEFELDDPGDTVLVSSLLDRLGGYGVALAATSNTLPDRLGEQRFATDDFLREIQGLAARFTAVRVDGPDFRHRGRPEAPNPWTEGDVRAHAASTDGATLDDFDALIEHLARLHPSRYGALVDGVSAVHLLGVRPAPDQNVALRLVVLADRLYDRQVPLVASGGRLDELFDDDMLAGGYRKKYHRAISRLVALARREDGRG